MQLDRWCAQSACGLHVHLQVLGGRGQEVQGPAGPGEVLLSCFKS